MTLSLDRLRYNLGLAMLDLVRLASRNGNPEATYRRCWRAARRLSWLLRARQTIGNSFRLSWEPFVAERLLARIGGKEAIPEWAVRTDAAMIARVTQAMSSPAVVVGVHSGVSEAAILAIRRVGGEPVVVRTRTDAGDQSVEKLHPGSNILLLIRKSLKQGKSVLVAIDFSSADPETSEPRHYLSTVLFDVAARLDAPLLFAGSKVEEDGIIRSTLSDVMWPTGSDGEAQGLAEEFREFIRRWAGTSVDWTVLTSSSEVSRIRRTKSGRAGPAR